MTPCPDCRPLVSDLETRLAAAQTALEFETARRTLGGTPPRPDPSWGNVGLPAPESASTGPGSPTGMSPSTDPRHWSTDG